jgi:hypothetical protein
MDDVLKMPAEMGSLIDKMQDGLDIDVGVGGKNSMIDGGSSSRIG